MFTTKSGKNYTMNNMFFNAGLGSDSDYDSENSEESEESYGRRMETNVLTQQNYFNNPSGGLFA